MSTVNGRKVTYGFSLNSRTQAENKTQAFLNYFISLTDSNSALYNVRTTINNK